MIKKVLTLNFGLVAAMCFTACSDDIPKDNTELITIWISAETTTVYDEWLDADMECMLVKFSPDSEWEPMYLGMIQGFAYEKGVEYELRVYRSTQVNGPGAGVTFAYHLDKIISQTTKRVVVDGFEQGKFKIEEMP